MKQPKVLSASPELPPPPPAPTGPRYRYSQVPPEKVSLRVGDLVSHVPQESWVLGSDADQTVEFSAAEILGGPVPKIPLSRLVELAPKSFRLPNESAKTEVRLPISRLVAAYQLVSEKVVIEEEPWVNLAPPSLEETAKVEPVSPSSSIVEELASERFAPPPPKEEPKADKTPEVKEVPEVKKEGVEASTSTSQEPPAQTPSTPDVPIGLIPPPLPPVPQDTPEKNAPSRRIFSVLPMFRRKGAGAPAPEVPPPVPSVEAEAPVKRPRVELPPLKNVPPAPVAEETEFSPPPSLRSAPRPPLGAIAAPRYGQPPEAVKESVPPKPPATEAAQHTVPEPAPVEAAPKASAAPAVLPEPPVVTEPSAASSEPASAEVTKEVPPAPPAPAVPPEPPPLPVIPPPPAPTPTVTMEAEPMSLVKAEKEAGGLKNQDDLQAIFLTEETLTPERIVELCGGFPGINSCVLSRGAGIIASHNVPDSIDIISLSAHALDMIRAMRESSAKMGVGAIPAVTLHSEKGPITFFHEDDLCFLVLHKDRGFVPGVREKLQQVVHHLAQARLEKPVHQPSRVLEG